jgi:HAD superfamily hydrolase (TIGR01509 family)
LVTLPSTVRALIFDVDGVLVDSPHERAWGDTVRASARELGIDPAGWTPEVYQRWVAGKPRLEGAKALLQHFGGPEERAEQIAEMKQQNLLKLLDAGQFKVFDDAIRLVARCRHLGKLLAVASSSKNANRMLALIEHGAGTLLDVFDVNVCGRDFGAGKPDPTIFLSAAAPLGVPPDACVVVEDATSGVLAGLAAGMAVLGIARLDDRGILEAARATWVVESLDDAQLA